jgi:hypothetical protein
LTFSSCSKPEENIKMIDSDYILIIPQNGCPGCIDKGIEFAKGYVDNGCLTIVLSRISNLRNLKIKFGYNNVVSSNVYLDTLGRFHNQIEGYPKFYYGNQIIELDNSSLEKYKALEKILADCP